MDSIDRNLVLYCLDIEQVKNFKAQNIDIYLYKAIYPQIVEGYNRAYIHDMEYYQIDFYNRFDIALNTEASIFAFYNELLFQGIDQDLEKAQLYGSDYFNKLGGNKKNKITPEYFIHQILEFCYKQMQVSKKLEYFIPSSQYKN